MILSIDGADSTKASILPYRSVSAASAASAKELSSVAMDAKKHSDTQADRVDAALTRRVSRLVCHSI